MYRLPFPDDGYEHGPIRWIQQIAEHEVPDRPGAYVLLAKPGVMFMYPRYRSSIFYIGQALNLRNRLQDHSRFIIEAGRRRRLTLYYPMYEYGAAFGCRYTFFRARRRDPKLLEQHLLAMFAEHYRAWPIANAAGGWDSLLSPRQLAARRDA